MNIQFKKGVLDMCVLAMLEEGDRYGYDIANALSKEIDISDGTVYPILRRLKQEGYVLSYLMESTGGPPRKYYTLTPSGRTLLQTLRQDWHDFEKQVNRLLDHPTLI